MLYCAQTCKRSHKLKSSESFVFWWGHLWPFNTNHAPGSHSVLDFSFPLQWEMLKMVHLDPHWALGGKNTACSLLTGFCQRRSYGNVTDSFTASSQTYLHSWDLTAATWCLQFTSPQRPAVSPIPTMFFWSLLSGFYNVFSKKDVIKKQLRQFLGKSLWPVRVGAPMLSFLWRFCLIFRWFSPRPSAFFPNFSPVIKFDCLL